MIKKINLQADIRSRLRIVTYLDETYKVHVSRCLETGSVATADTKQIAEEMINELLDDEVAYAIKNRNLANLFSTPAPIEVWERFLLLQNEDQNGVTPGEPHGT